MRNKAKKCPELKAFILHRNGAARRGIAFHFTYEEWCAWWKYHLGPDWFKLRGKRMGQYCMARRGDKGPYARYNVKCLTHSENSRTQPANGKLTEAQVTSIYLALKGRRLSIVTLARHFKVSKWTIKAIRRKEAWRLVTDLLD